MVSLTIIIIAVIALAGYPVGLLVARMTTEELEAGRKWFRIIIVACIAAIALSIIFANGETLLFLVASFVFIALVALASLVKAGAKRVKIKRIKRKRR